MKALTIIEVRDLRKEFVMGDTRIAAVNGISLDIERGEFIAIVGPSGSGKTTLLNLIGALDKPTSGTVIIDGMDIGELKGDQLSDIRRAKIGFIFQLYNLIPVLTALENVELPCLPVKLPRGERRKRARAVLERVGLEARMGHKPSQLSGGEQQRVAIARALMNNPLIILADEPTGNVDSETAQSIMSLMRELNQERGVTFMIATHDLRVAEIADKQIQLKDGGMALIARSSP